MNINLSYFGSTPATAMADFNAAAAILDNLITDNITVNFLVSWSGSGGGASSVPIAVLPDQPYSTVYGLLTGNESPGDTTFQFLPNANQISGQSSVTVWNAEAKAMGLLSGTATGIDDESLFSTDISSSLLIGVALHEFGHALGRVPGGPPTPDVMEFERYTSIENRLFTSAIPAPASYFSLNDGVTKWADWGQTSDPGDFLNNNLTPNDPFNEFYNSSTFQYLTPADLEQLDSLGFHLNQFAPAVDHHDFNGDGHGDILLQSGNGQIIYGDMVFGVLHNFIVLGNTPGYSVVGAGKISGGLDSDVVIQNGGQILYGNVVGGTIANYVTVGNAPGFTVVGVGDINRDKHADIVLENQLCALRASSMCYPAWSAHAANTPRFAPACNRSRSQTGCALFPP
jgi:hypothetical protein